jgi:hypothetical protein
MDHGGSAAMVGHAAAQGRDPVTHDKYGPGLLDVGERAILVNFGTHRVRIALPCAKLFKGVSHKPGSGWLCARVEPPG